ncbi:MAG: hypothetical protein HY074_00625 [Deltaproteobacteria bacterium]|nr:hypothetical protein [Deltaproteobacteria bacterium]
MNWLAVIVVVVGLTGISCQGHERDATTGGEERVAPEASVSDEPRAGSQDENAAELQPEPQGEKPPTTDNENMGIPQSQNKVVCSDSPHAHPQFLRSDLAYSVTGVDCAGDMPRPLGEESKAVGRGIASEKLKCGPYDHPMFLREDLSYSVTGQDCYGDEIMRK